MLIFHFLTVRSSFLLLVNEGLSHRSVHEALRGGSFSSRATPCQQACVVGWESLCRRGPFSHLTRKQAALWGGRCNHWCCFMLFRCYCVALGVSSGIHSVPTSNVCHVANITLILSQLYESYISFLLLFFLSAKSFFGVSFIGVTQSFMTGLHSSIVAGVTWNFNYWYMTSWFFPFFEDTPSLGGKLGCFICSVGLVTLCVTVKW